jgi:non-specific serine/threonine protein kinase
MEATGIRCGEFRVDVANRRFTKLGREVPLEPRVFAVIARLVERAGQLVTRHELLDAVWGHRYVTASTLNRTIALARRAFGDDVAEPRYIQTVHGAGYRYVGPHAPPDPEELGVRARFAPPASARLPARLEPLVGRGAELAALEARLSGHRLVTVAGPGGMGKTQCALEAARRVALAFPDGVWWFDLSPATSALDWLSMLGAALGVRGPPEHLLEPVCGLLDARTALLVLDNCDRIAAEVGRTVFELVRAAPDLRVLATSRRPLDVAGEQVVRLPALPVPPAADLDGLTPGEVEGFAAVELLVRRVRAIRPEFAIDAANAPVVAEICIALDGMPLALELAAARFSLLSPQQVLDRLVQRFRFLESRAAGREDRHRSLEKLLEWSYALLSADEQRLLAWCAVFTPSWSAELLVPFAAALGHDAERAIDLLSGLVEHSLVAVATDAIPPRYRLLESVREYALEKLAASGEEQAAREAHLDAVAAVARVAARELRTDRMRERVEQLVLDAGNVQAALATSAALGSDEPRGLEILGALLLHAKGHGAYATMLGWCRTVMAPRPLAETAARARALLTLGVVQVHMVGGDAFIPDALLDAARIAHAAGDAWTEGYAHGYRALHEANAGQPDAAEVHARELAERVRESGDPLLAGLLGLARGWTWLARNSPEQALEELVPARELGTDLHQRHFIDMYIALASFALGRVPAAARQWRAGLSLSAALGNVRGMAGSIEGCGYLACRAGEWRDAARLLASAEAIRTRTQVPIFNFWRPHQAAALATLRTQLSAAELSAAQHEGAGLHQERVANLAMDLLARYAAPADGGPPG